MKPSRYIAGLNLRMKFLIPISAMLVASMLIIGGYLIARQSDSFHRELESGGETMIRMLAINAESGVLFESTAELDHLMNVLYQFGEVEYCRISNLEGVVLSHIGQNLIDSTELKKVARDQNGPRSAYVADRNGRQLFVLAAPITTEKSVLSRETLGITATVDSAATSTTNLETIGWIELGLSVERVNRDIAQATRAAILLALLVIITTIAMIIFIVNAITRPVTELVDATDLISRGDFSTKVEIEQRDEIGHLASTFNQMIDSLKLSRDEIEQYNRTLEEKIIERTQQLEDAQAQLVQSEKLSAIGQLAAGVAHELNNPLGGILGYAQFTLEKLRKNVPEKTQAKEIQSYIRYVSDIEVQARRCKTIVQNLLRFSRSSRTVEFEDLDVNRTIEETVTFVEHQLRISQMELDIQLTPDLPIIRGNAGQLQQVFTNLLINAMHASQPGAHIRIQSRYSPPLGEFGGTVEIAVSDSGHGIAEENLKKIFEPFFTTKEIGKGTGLGLSVSYGIVKEHGGEISVESEVGKGTTFTIVLPVQKMAVPADTVDVKNSVSRP
jgi:signal transduction histidine kinase